MGPDARRGIGAGVDLPFERGLDPGAGEDERDYT